MDFAFVPYQMFCFSLVTVCIVVPYYTVLSGIGARVASESAKSSAESMRQLAASLGRERFLPFWFMQSLLVQIQDAMNDFS